MGWFKAYSISFVSALAGGSVAHYLLKPDLVRIWATFEVWAPFWRVCLCTSLEESTTWQKSGLVFAGFGRGTLRTPDTVPDQRLKKLERVRYIINLSAIANNDFQGTVSSEVEDRDERG
eukprot:9480005-Pyramimonas_sp.AAC.1